ncbi:dihydroxy-acid dehydratase [Mesotoga prima]|jgi:dihydroxy-acid dehydratase|uniref:dihydroxy-acid dehydratase n=1 Tax=Mesotoga prima TaxID=1184387 RepID=UPI002BA1D95C|nr:dihydroxy-acid dehydratase [Mesotoga prima]HQC14785.1 dihydroxy-acid dehydratase [Mesotoga prima]
MGEKLESLPRFTRALIKSHLIACGFSYEDTEKPIIGIVNSWNEFNHGHIPQREIADKVKDGVRAKGGLPLEFNTIGPCDALAQGYEAMDFILPSREVIADSIEAMVLSQNVIDGLVFISSCDKITPGMLMSILRLNIPSIHICSGTCTPAISFADSKKLRNEFLTGKISERELAEGNARLYPQPGICPYIGTAQSMNCVAEALGLALPGSAACPSCTNERLTYAIRTGETIVDVAVKKYKPSDFIDKNSFDNALMVMAALAASMNHLLHVPAVASEFDINIDFDYIGEINSRTPQLCTVNPNGEYSMADFAHAGGVPAVLKQLGDLINGECKNVEGKTMKEITSEAVVRDERIIRPSVDPVSKTGGIVILKGNIARNNAVVKRSTIPAGMMKFTGPARVFDGEEQATDAIENGLIHEGDIVVIRYVGPKGGPGMRELHRVAGALKSIGEKVAVVTEGRFSGATGGLAIGYLGPESAEGGAIGILRDGDIIDIDIEKKSINAVLTDREIEKRLANFVPKNTTGKAKLLDEYAKRVGPVNNGAVRLRQ